MLPTHWHRLALHVSLLTLMQLDRQQTPILKRQRRGLCQRLLLLVIAVMWSQILSAVLLSRVLLRSGLLFLALLSVVLLRWVCLPRALPPPAVMLTGSQVTMSMMVTLLLLPHR